MVDASGFAETWLCFAISAFELLVLFYGWRINKVTWEPLWILFTECFSYGSAAAVPDAPFRTLLLANGRELPWPPPGCAASASRSRPVGAESPSGGRESRAR